MHQKMRKRIFAMLVAVCCTASSFSGMTYAQAAEETAAENIKTSGDTLNVVLTSSGSTMVDTSTVKDSDNGNNPYIAINNTAGNQNGYLALSTAVTNPMNIDIGEAINLGDVDSNAKVKDSKITSSGTYHLGYKGYYTMDLAGGKGGDATLEKIEFLGMTGSKTAEGAAGSTVVLQDSDPLAYNSKVTFGVGKKGTNKTTKEKLDGTNKYNSSTYSNPSYYYQKSGTTYMTFYGQGTYTLTKGEGDDQESKTINTTLGMLVAGAYSGGMSYVKVGNNYYIAGGGGAGNVVGYYDAVTGKKGTYTHTGLVADTVKDWTMEAYEDPSFKSDVMCRIYDNSIPASSFEAVSDQYLALVQQYCALGVTKGTYPSAYVKSVYKNSVPMLTDALGEKDDEKFMLYVRIIFECARRLC